MVPRDVFYFRLHHFLNAVRRFQRGEDAVFNFLPGDGRFCDQGLFCLEKIFHLHLRHDDAVLRRFDPAEQNDSGGKLCNGCDATSVDAADMIKIATFIRCISADMIFAHFPDAEAMPFIKRDHFA